MRAVIAAGGTAGHINPALATAAEIMKNEPDSHIIFVGREDGMEKKLVEQAGFTMYPIEIHGLERSFSPASILWNMKAGWSAVRALGQAKHLFCKFRPDVVMGFGGYISGPVVLQAAQMGIPTAIQEQNAFPGVTTKMLARKVKLILASTDAGAKRLGYPEKTVIVGNPVRPGFFTTNRTEERRKRGIGNRVCLLSFGGSLGAGTINLLAAAVAKRNSESGRVFHIHGTGRYGVNEFPEMLKKEGVAAGPELCVREYIDDMEGCFAAADLILCRAGAITISELAASGKASVLIPSPNVAENHQYHNAMALAGAGASLVFEERDLNIDEVADRIWALLQDRQQLAEMGVCARTLAVPDSAALIYCNIKRLLGGE